MKNLEPNCRYNVGVSCPDIGRDCICCGWNPCEAERRNEEIRESMKSANPGEKFSLTLNGDVNA